MTFFSWSETPPKAWVDDLASISPPSPQLGHAELWWEAGFPWAPVQRYVVYELIPLAAMGREAREDWTTLMEMEQPCRCSNIWTSGGLCSLCLEAWPCSCGSYTQAEAIRCSRCKCVRSQGRTNLMHAFKRGYQAHPLWVIQGEHGGHKLRYTGSERIVAVSLGMAEKPPEPGTLPFAGWDKRVKMNLLHYDMAQRRFASLKRARAHEREQLERAARTAQEAYLTGIIEAAKCETPVTFADELPQIGSAVDDASVSARYIETGRLGPT